MRAVFANEHNGSICGTGATLGFFAFGAAAPDPERATAAGRFLLFASEDNEELEDALR